MSRAYHRIVNQVEPDDGNGSVKQAYLDAITLIERLHRHFLDVLRSELDRLGLDDINNVQSLILFNIGDDELTVGELTNRGYYLGTNVTYNLKKLVEHGYVVQERSPRDRRSVRVKLSPKGLDLCGKLNAVFDQHAEVLKQGVVSEAELRTVTGTLRALENFWTGTIGHRSPLSQEAGHKAA